MTTPDIDLSTYCVDENSHGGRSLWQRTEDPERPRFVVGQWPGMDVLAAALGAVEQLTSELREFHLAHGPALYEQTMQAVVARAEQAEAEVERLNRVVDLDAQTINGLVAQVERVRALADKWDEVNTTTECPGCSACTQRLIAAGRLRLALDPATDRAEGSEPEHVDCTCGHPNADHESGVCPFRGCGCGALDAADRAQSDGGAR